MTLIRDEEKGGGGRGMEVGAEGGYIYTNRYSVTTRMIPALRWAAMRAVLIFHNCEGQSHKTVSTDHNFWNERRAEADSNRGLSAYQPNALLLGQTGSQSQITGRLIHTQMFICCCCNLMFYDSSEYVKSVLGPRKHSSCNQCIDTWQ